MLARQLQPALRLPIQTALRLFSSQAIEDVGHPNVLLDIKDSKPPNSQRPPSKHTPVTGAFLRKYGRDLTAEAAEGRLDPLIGRDKELTRIVQILLRRTKNNVVLIGDPGVGKTALVEKLAQLTVSPTCPPALRHRSVVSLDLGSLVSGTQYRGSFEERLQGVMNDVKVASGRIILFVDEIHLLTGSTKVEQGTNAADLLKPPLARGEIRLIGATTVEEYRKHIESDGAFARRLQPVMIEEPEPEVAIQWLNNLKTRLETFHNVTFTPDAISTAVHAAQKFTPDRKLPDSAIDLLDETAARASLGLSLHQLYGDVKVEGTATDIVQEPATEAQDQQPPSHSKVGVGGEKPVQPQNNHQKFRWWLESVSHGRSPQEINDLLQWFGAQPDHPLPGRAGHRQTTEARRLEAMKQKSLSSVSQTPTGNTLPNNTDTSQAFISSEPYATGAAVKVGYNAALSCPHCGTPTPAVPGSQTVACPNCKFRFLNIPPDKLILGASLFASSQQLDKKQLENNNNKAPPVSSTSSSTTTSLSEDNAEDNTGQALPPEFSIEYQPIISSQDILTVASEAAGIPTEHALQSRNSALINLESTLREDVFGQREAIASVVRSVRLGYALSSSSNRSKPKRPLASFLLTGPPSTGKSTLCRSLAESLFGTHRAFLRIDLNRCSDKTAVSKLIGAPPGYVGYGDGGELTDAVRRRPHSVVYLEGADGAHPEVLALVMEVLKQGELRDSQGRLADFRNAVVVLTVDNTTRSSGTNTKQSTPSPSTNNGNAEGKYDAATTIPPEQDDHANFSSSYQPRSGHMAAALPNKGDDDNSTRTNGHHRSNSNPLSRLPPELLGLVDTTVTFQHLTRSDLTAMASRIIEETAESLREISSGVENSTAVQGIDSSNVVDISVNHDVIEHLVGECEHRGGARRLQTLIREKVFAPSVDMIMAGVGNSSELHNGLKVVVEMNKGKTDVSVTVQRV